MRTPAWELKVLGRPEHKIDFAVPLERLRSERILVTGASGSLGRPLVDVLYEAGITYLATDLDPIGWDSSWRRMDVTNPDSVLKVFGAFRPTLVIHLAGAKHAPEGESHPLHTTRVNVDGTVNVLNQGVRTVLASTCKSCDPETAYGASKLIAERMTLNARGTVARFYNVARSAGNVFEIWRAFDESSPLPVTDCFRYFISLREAIGLTLWASVLPSGRYTIDPGDARAMHQVAASLYPGREQLEVERRRGDRWAEPPFAVSEEPFPLMVPVNAKRLAAGLVRISSPHDPQLIPEERLRSLLAEFVERRKARGAAA